MQELKIGNYDLLNPAKGKEKQIIDCYVQFYGEQYRDLITERFYDTSMLFIPKGVNDYKTFLDTLQKQYKRERTTLEEEFLQSIKYNYSRVKSRVFSPSYANVLIVKINSDNLTADDYKCIFEVLICKFNQTFEGKPKQIVNAWLESSANKKRLCDALSEIYNSWRSSSYYADARVLGEQVNKIEEITKQSADSTRELNNLLKINIQTALIENLKKHRNLTYAQMRDIKNLDFFIELHQKILDEGEDFLTDDTVSEFDKLRYIKFFKFLGFDYGNDYFSYIEDSKLGSILFDKDLVNQIMAYKKDCIEKQIKGNVFFNYILENFQKKDSLFGTSELTKYALKFANTIDDAFAITDFYYDNNRVLHRYCLFESCLTSGDDTFIHELHHALSFAGVLTENMIKVFCGVATVSTPHYEYKDFEFEDMLHNDDIFNEDVEAKHELLNEVITDYFSYIVLGIFKENNLRICAGKNEKSYYTNAFGMMQDFIDDNIDVLKHAFLTNNMKNLYKIITKDEFDELSDKIDEFFDVFDEIKISNIVNEIQENTGLQKNILYEVKPYMNKDLGWSKTAKRYFEFVEYVDALNEKIKQRKRVQAKINQR